MWTDDPVADYHRHCDEQEQKLARLPVCENPRCKKRIQDDYYFYIDGEILCEDCMNSRYRKDVDCFD